MAAVLTHTPRPAAAPAPWNEPVHGPGRRPSLTVVEGGRSAAAAVRRRRAAARLAASLGAGLVLAAVVALVALGATALLGADAAAPGPASTAEAPGPAGAGTSTTPAPAEVVVRPGDSLWAIARRLQPTGDVRPLVDALAERAGGAAVVVGQRLDLSGLLD